MAQLLLTRHGQSEYNLKNLFTGWLDVELTEKGKEEAKGAALLIKETNIKLDHSFTSKLKRANHTLDIILEELNLVGKIPVVKNEAINERHYGDLQGKNKKEMAEKFGAEQVHTWRRSFDTPPPGGESLKETAERSIPYFQSKIVPVLEENKNVLVAAHGNSLRSIVMHIEKLSPAEIIKKEIKTGELWIYDYKDGNFEKI